MKIFDKRKLRIFLIRHNNLITLLKLFVILTVIFIMNLNRKFISCIFYALIFDTFMLNKMEKRFHKYLLNIMIFTMLLIERLLFIEKHYTNFNLMLMIIFLCLIILIIKLDFVANRMNKYNFNIFYLNYIDHELKRNMSKRKIRDMFKTISILAIIISLRINIIIIAVTILLLFKQICLKEDQLDKSNNTIIDLVLFLIISLSILFKSNSIKIVESVDLAMILLIGTIIATSWILNNKK